MFFLINITKRKPIAKEKVSQNALPFHADILSCSLGFLTPALAGFHTWPGAMRIGTRNEALRMFA